MDAWLYQPLATAAAIDAKTGDLDPTVWHTLVRALRLVSAGSAGTASERQRLGLWSGALRLLADARGLLPSFALEAAPEADLDRLRGPDLDRDVRQRAADVTDAVRARRPLLNVELARVVDGLAGSLIAALGATDPAARLAAASAASG